MKYLSGAWIIKSKAFLLKAFNSFCNSCSKLDYNMTHATCLNASCTILVKYQFPVYSWLNLYDVISFSELLVKHIRNLCNVHRGDRIFARINIRWRKQDRHGQVYRVDIPIWRATLWQKNEENKTSGVQIWIVIDETTLVLMVLTEYFAYFETSARTSGFISETEQLAQYLGG